MKLPYVRLGIAVRRIPRIITVLRGLRHTTVQRTVQIVALLTERRLHVARALILADILRHLIIIVIIIKAFHGLDVP